MPADLALIAPTDDLDASPVHYRDLTPRDVRRFRDHLLRLDPMSRRSRFGGGVGANFIAAYAERVLSEATVVGLFVAGKLRGAAELHAVDAEGRRMEIAFSLEASLRGAGLGRRLFEIARHRAERQGVEALLMQCLAENRAMLSIARRAGATLRFEDGEAHARVALPPLGEPARRDPSASAAAAARGLGQLRDHLVVGEAALG